MVRKRILQDIIQPSNVILPSIYVENAGIELKKMTEERNWEGIVANARIQFTALTFAVTIG